MLYSKDKRGLLKSWIGTLVLIFMAGCFKKSPPPTLEQCEQLSMQAFRGLPIPAKKFKDDCGTYKIHYSQKRCQQALQNLMLGVSQKTLEEKFGPLIMGCFNQGDLDRFLKAK